MCHIEVSRKPKTINSYASLLHTDQALTRLYVGLWLQSFYTIPVS